MAVSKKMTVAAAEAMYRQIKQKYDRQKAALGDTEMQLTVAEQFVDDARAAEKQKDLVSNVK